MTHRPTACGLVLLIICTILLSGCVDGPEAQTRADVVRVSPDSPGKDAAAEETPQRQQFEERLLEIAQSYESYGRVHVDYQWAHVMCAPDSEFIPEIAFSESSDSRAHGHKLYALYAKMISEPAQYLVEEPLNPVGQVVVKESWVPEEMQPEQEPRNLLPNSNDRDSASTGPDEAPVSQTIFHEGRLFRPKTKSELFIMLKLDTATPGTDEGWVYGVVAPDGKRVISAGRVASCMSCHLEAPHDRLFGPHLPQQ